jgi:hypothetical protein
MKITKSELKEIIKESVIKNSKLIELKNKLNKVNLELKKLNENEEFEVSPQEVVEKSESIFDSKPGETVILNFEGVTIKIERQLDDLFKVVDAAESQKIKDGDYIKVQGDDNLESGKTFKFKIYRETNLPYETNVLQSWKIIKN